MKKYLLFLLFIPTLIIAQDKYSKRPEFTVTGLVLDTLNNKRLAFSALSFISPKDNLLITGGICNERSGSRASMFVTFRIATQLKNHLHPQQ